MVLGTRVGLGDIPSLVAELDPFLLMAAVELHALEHAHGLDVSFFENEKWGSGWQGSIYIEFLRDVGRQSAAVGMV